MVRGAPHPRLDGNSPSAWSRESTCANADRVHPRTARKSARSLALFGGCPDDIANDERACDRRARRRLAMRDACTLYGYGCARHFNIMYWDVYRSECHCACASGNPQLYPMRCVCGHVPCIFVNDTTREATSPQGSRASMAMWWSTPLLAHNPKSMTDGDKGLAIKFNPTPTSIRCPTLRTATEATQSHRSPLGWSPPHRT